MNRLKYPPYLQWEVTPKCNHNCLHCYNYWRKEDDFDVAPVEHIKIAKRIVEVHPVSVVITGGEPLLQFDNIVESIKLLRNNNISVSINTNATLVTDKIAKFLKTNVMSAFVSLPCCDPKICDLITNAKDSLRKISEGIKILVSNDVPVSVNMVVSKINLNTIYETAKYAKNELGVNSFFASRVSKPINSSANFDSQLLSKDDVIYMCKELIKISKELNIRTESSTPIPACLFTDQCSFEKFAYTKSCSAGKSSYGLDCSGNIKACPRDIEIYGNILTDNFSEVWEKMAEWRDGSFIPSECKKCNVFNKCNGGCRLDSYPITCSRKDLDPLVSLQNIPIKYNKKTKVINFESTQEFLLPNAAIFIKEVEGWRISCGKKYLIITSELKEYLENNHKFYFDDFKNAFNVDYDIANQALNLLYSKGILRLK